ncbi:MAG: FHA domain-containing protein, partial [Pseudomonadota bacterium]
MTDTVRLPNAASENGRESRPVLLLRNVREGDKADTQRFELDKFRLLIGRADTADIRLDEGHGASRHHAQVFVIDGEVVIEDMSSRNGTYVNRKLIRGERQTTLNYG